MSHNIFQERFGSVRAPAWHKLGKVFAEPLTAVEAFSQIGRYTVELVPLQTVASSDQEVRGIAEQIGGLNLTQRAIVAWSGATSTTSVIGIAGTGYTLMTPDEVVDCWDRATLRKIETIGVLGRGEKMFVTALRPSFSVNGDEIRVYVVLVASFDGKSAQRVFITTVRIVCQNTLVSGMRAASAMYRIVHLSHVVEETEQWLKRVSESIDTRVADIHAAYRQLSDKRITDSEAERLLTTIYSVPAVMPARDGGTARDRERVALWAMRNEKAVALRDAALELYSGRGIGSSMVSTAGTLFGLWNAVVELEDYRNTKGDGKLAAQSAVLGDRARVKADAFNLLLARAGRS